MGKLFEMTNIPYDKTDSFKWFLDHSLKKINGTWEDASGEAEPSADFGNILTAILLADIIDEDHKEAVAEIAAIIGGSLEAEIKKFWKTPKDKLTPSLVDENDYVYELLALMVSQKCRESDSIRTGIVGLYKNRYQQEYEMVEELAGLYDNEINDENVVAGDILQLFEYIIDHNEDEHGVRSFSTILFMVDASIRCGHVLPYRLCGTNVCAGGNGMVATDNMLMILPYTSRALDEICGNVKKTTVDCTKDVPVMPKDSAPYSMKVEGRLNDIQKDRTVILNKYLRNRYVLLAEHLGCEVTKDDVKQMQKNIAARLWENGYKGNDSKSKIYGAVAENNLYKAKYARDHFIESRDDNRKEYIDMMADIVLRLYYTLRLEELLKEREKSGTFVCATRHEIIAEIGTDTIKEDAAFLADVAYVAAAFNCTKNVQERFLDNFNFFKNEGAAIKRMQAVHKTELERNEKKIEGLNKEIESLQNVIETISSKKKKDARQDALNSLARKTAKLEESLTKKDDEIDVLNRRVSELLEYIEMKEAAEDITETEEDKAEAVTPADLRGKRFVFVCHNVNDIYPDLRKEFPDSVFMDSHSSPKATGNIDAVVYVINHISHSLQEKTQSLYKDVPVVYFNKKNLNAMYKAIAEVVL